MGYSLGSYIAQQLRLSIQKRLTTLYSLVATCGGKDGTPKPPEFMKMQSEVVNKSLNNIPTSAEEMQAP